VEQLEEVLTRPTAEVVDAMRRLKGDVMVLGVGGKIGPTLARMARRACDAAGVSRRVIGIDRAFSPEISARFKEQGIETIACDLLDRAQVGRLPEVPNILYLAGMKFGATGAEALTWAMNCYLPAVVCERFPRSRIVAYSTGNIYGLVPVSGSGSREGDELRPEGDYAMSCLGRERIFSHFSQALGIPTVLFRLNYAHEMRYGVTVDIGQQVLAGQPVDVTMGYYNAIWQGDCIAMTLRALEHAASPAVPINVAGPEKLRTREVAEEFGRLLGKPVKIIGTAAQDALLSDGRRGYELLGRPQVTAAQMIRWIAGWISRGGASLNKPTHFQTRDGKF